MKFTYLVKLILTITSLLLGHSIMGLPNDSLGIVNKNGGSFIEHKIDAGNTLYSLSKRYNVSIEDIKKANSFTDLKVNEKILIPLSNTTQQTKKYHTVSSGETLYSISKSTGISVDQLKSYNKLIDNNLSLGQRLIIGYGPSSNSATSKNPSTYVGTNTKDKKHVVQQGETLYSIARKHNVSLERIQRKNSVAYGNISPGDTLIIPAKSKSLETKTLTMYNSTSSDLDQNLAEIISPVGQIGSIVKIQSEENGKVVYARVIKKSEDDKVYASKKIYLLLGLESFSVNSIITYVK